MVTKKISTGRSRGHIRQRGNSHQVLVYAGLDPLIGKEMRLTGSASTESEAKALLKRFRAQVDEQRAPTAGPWLNTGSTDRTTAGT